MTRRQSCLFIVAEVDDEVQVVSCGPFFFVLFCFH